MEEKKPEACMDIAGSESELSPAALRRDFLKRFGRYAVSTPAVVFTLMSVTTSKAVASGTGGNEGAP